MARCVAWLIDAIARALTDVIEVKGLFLLPQDAAVRVVAFVQPVEECCRLARVCKFLRGLVDPALELRVREAGGSVAVVAEWQGTRRSWLVFTERRLQMSRPQVVAGGGRHTLIVEEGGGVLSCGTEQVEEEMVGVLGHGAEVRQLLVPTRVPALAGVRICSVAAGPSHSLALVASGQVFSWGLGGSGQLGHGDMEDKVTPKIVEALKDVEVASVAAGAEHNMAVTAAGAVYSWGEGDCGRLGHGDWEDELTPKLVDALQSVRVVVAAAGRMHSLALTETGKVYSWGWGRDGQRGHGNEEVQLTPTLVEALRGMKLVSVVAGEDHSLALSEAGGVYSWGSGSDGQLGHGDWENQHTPKLVEALRDVKVASVAPGNAPSLAVANNDDVYSWGYGRYGQLGHGNQQYQLTPKLIEALQGVAISSVAALNSCSLAVSKLDAVYSWGYGGHGSLGHGDTESRHVPELVEGVRALKE